MSGTPVEIVVSVERGGWEDAIPDVEALVLRAAEAAIARDAAEPGTILPAGPAELSVVLTDDATVRELNRTWRGKDKATNVLSFAIFADGDDADGQEMHESLAEGGPIPVLLGDVVLASETVAREAAEQGKPLSDHLTHLTVHGVLHLLGHDHIDDSDAALMERLETEILAGLGIADPYAGGDGYQAPDEPSDDADVRPEPAPSPPRDNGRP